LTIHDHFNGSAHCVECGGFCALTGEARAVTEFIRFTLERMAHQGWRTVPYFERRAMIALGLNPEQFLARALEFSAPPETPGVNKQASFKDSV